MTCGGCGRGLKGESAKARRICGPCFEEPTTRRVAEARLTVRDRRGKRGVTCIEPGCGALVSRKSASGRCAPCAKRAPKGPRRPPCVDGCGRRVGRDSVSGRCSPCANARRSADLRAVPVLPPKTGPEVVSMPVRPWAIGRGGGDWLGVSTWADQVRPTVAAVSLPMGVAAPPTEWNGTAKGAA